MSDKKQKESKVLEPADYHLREAHLAEGVEKHFPPVNAPASVNPMLSQTIAPIPLLKPEMPSVHLTKKISDEKSPGKKPTVTKI